MYRGSEYQIDFLPKSKVEVAIEDSMLEKVIEVVKAATSTGEIGDGKIFVSELQEVVRIRTENQELLLFEILIRINYKRNWRNIYRGTCN